jgi:RNA polymerase sigma factor (sigma-70 family)
MKADLPKVLRQLQQAGGGLADAELLARFVAARDEDAFATLVRRHGPMVLGVCRRVLANAADAEDAFQAAFLVLARRAAAVAHGGSVGCWLYGVAYRTALAAARANARRRTRERQVRDMPHPEAAPADVPDWRPLLDRELNRLSERYRAAVVLCDLDGRTRKEAARLLGVPESTLSSRLTRARALLAKRLRGRGVGLTGAALAAALAADAAAARVPAALTHSTARLAALAAAGDLAGAAAPAVVLMKGVMQAMLLKKLRLGVMAVLVTAALGAVGLACRTSDEARAQDTARAGDGKPLSELEALRRENQRLRKNVEILLDRISAQDKELKTARAQAAATGAKPFVAGRTDLGRSIDVIWGLKQVDLANIVVDSSANVASPDPTHEAEAALKALREARDLEARRRAAQALERATQRIRQQVGPEPASRPKQ